MVAITDDSGTLITQQRYLPFGGMRELSGYSTSGLTDFTYTGQRTLDPGMGGLMDYKARFYSSILGRFIQPDTLIPNPVNPQAWNRFSYVGNRPINFNDPTGHVACQTKEDCQDMGTTPGAGLGKLKPKANDLDDYCDLDCQFSKFEDDDDFPDRVQEDQMISIGAPLPYMYDSISPAEYQLLLRQNKLGPYTYMPALDANLAFTMFLIQQQATSAAQTQFADTDQLNSPADAFRHAYWNALLTREFGSEFASDFTTAHETGWTSRDDGSEMSFMDMHNNQAGIDIALANPDMSDQEIQEAILATLAAGDLIVWDGSNLYYSNECPAC